MSQELFDILYFAQMRFPEADGFVLETPRQKARRDGCFEFDGQFAIIAMRQGVEISREEAPTQRRLRDTLTYYE